MSKHRLLLADDSVTIQKVVNLTFADEGIEVITAGDGNMAMEKFVESTPDLVMVDVNMPGLDGYRICEMIKQDDETKQIPVILLVGSFEPFDEAEARRVGADDYLTKPFQSIRQLVSRVTDLLNRSNGQSSPQNQVGFISENSESSQTETFTNSFADTSETPGDADFKPFDDAGIDDEMIQTNQIGSLPADETQKFVSETHFQTSENNFADTVAEEKAEEKAEDSPTVQPLAVENYEQTSAKAAGREVFQLDEKIFDFADEIPSAPKSEPDVLAKEAPKAFVNNENILSGVNVDTKPQPQNDSIFDFDDLNLLELQPPSPKQPVKVKAAAAEKIAVNSDAKNVDEKKALPQFDEKKESVKTLELSPEIIEAITRKIIERLSDKVIREIAREVAPQMAESIIKEMAQNK